MAAIAPDLLSIVSGGLTELADIARFRSVCTTWRDAGEDAAAFPPQQPPWLLLPSSPSPLFFCPPEDRLYPNLRLPVPNPQANRRRGRRLYASPHGWTLAIDPTGLAASLLHPFTGAFRPLPPLPAYFAETDDLAWDLSPFAVMASCGERGVLVCSLDPPADSWVPIPAMADYSVSSIDYAAGDFFVFEEDACRATVVDAITKEVTAVIPPPPVELPTEARMVVAGDELFVLTKPKWMYVFDDDVDFSKAFCVNHRSPNPVWQNLTSIGDRAVFVDSIHGFAVGTAGFRNLESNTVYSVTTKEMNRSSNVKYSISAFNLETRTAKKLACRLDGLEMAQRGGKVSWIIPSLKEA
ncbi:uncharacterized protein LOC124690193 [Lolium rigidum]|uniref:uncharacterized protein LOC124690193 n=1 Tax=Lolium rigidum TaxID=89674 RepID=UPI001F5C7C26|nr:uncharacterized protein LOC124690193 [Lolium rigidum]